jgi:hypothetical protein
MPLQVYGKKNTGEIWIEDQRPDGSVVMLVCTEEGTRTGHSVPDGGPYGVVTASTTDGGAYPMLREQGLVHRKLPPVHVDTTPLPAGVLRFQVGRFVQRAIEAMESGQREVTIDESNARDWGYIGPISTAAPADRGEARDKGPRSNVATAGPAPA